MASRLLVRSLYRYSIRPSRIAWITTKTPDFTSNPYDQYVNNAINSQGEQYSHRTPHSHGNITPLDESHDVPHHDHSTAAVPAKSAQKSGSEIDAQEEALRQWQWAVAEELMPDSKEERTTQILDEVGRMEVWMESVADRVKVVKEKLDEMEDEGGKILHLKDS